MRSVLDTHPHRIRVAVDPQFVTAGELCARLGVSRMWLRRYMAGHGFPRPIQFGGPTSARHWRVAEVEAWLTERATRSTSPKHSGEKQ